MYSLFYIDGFKSLKQIFTIAKMLLTFMVKVWAIYVSYR